MKLKSSRLDFPEISSNERPKLNETSLKPKGLEKKMKELEENLRLELCRRHRLLLEPSQSLPGFNLNRTVWVREIWVCGFVPSSFGLGFFVFVPSSFDLGFFVFVPSSFDLSSLFTFYVFLLRLAWASSFWFVFLLRVVWVSCFWFYGTRVCNARFPRIELESVMLDLAHQNRVPCTRDVCLLNSFENVLTNEIV